MQRLICILCRRFVILSRLREPNSLEESEGMPQQGTRYWWRYLDNQQNVFEVRFKKFRDSAGTFDMLDAFVTGRIPYWNLETATQEHGIPPGEFQSPPPVPRDSHGTRLHRFGILF